MSDSPHAESGRAPESAAYEVRIVRPCAEAPDALTAEGAIGVALGNKLKSLRSGDYDCRRAVHLESASVLQLPFGRLMIFDDGTFVITQLQALAELTGWFESLSEAGN